MAGARIRMIEQSWESGERVQLTLFSDDSLDLSVLDENGKEIFNADNFPLDFIQHLSDMMAGWSRDNNA